MKDVTLFGFNIPIKSTQDSKKSMKNVNLLRLIKIHKLWITFII